MTEVVEEENKMDRHMHKVQRKAKFAWRWTTCKRAREKRRQKKDI